MQCRRLPKQLVMAAALAWSGGMASAQLGQMSMAPAGGIVNGAVAGFKGLNENGPGWLYYGINAADRGLGYNGSYMTLGGFIPYGEDDLGGLWAADLRGHLSVNGGFFSNTGIVRKQFLGGSLFGVGVYWDYDGDQNQYPLDGQIGADWGQFGHAYNQVGVSTEWLTDYGNLRSNGYIPVGTTAYTVGAPNSPFVGNNVLCNYGLDAALTGADLEVGAYIPGLTDWAGMISVGGYALGNSRYDWASGSENGQDVVPWFGGVYTRLDMTFLENWDFSLQYNNDSYFDSTGFARLTYRMGGSRRRNVPDQVEQPMMRNEHIVRAHETPIAAVNPETGRAWNVIHVDDTAAAFGNGSAGAPYRTLAEAQADATNPYDIVFVRAGNSATTPYQSEWLFQADNQILVGEGSTLQIATANCGYERYFTGDSGVRPVLTSAGTAVTLRNGAVVDHFQITAAPVGVTADSSLTGAANVNDVAIVGGNQPGQVGIRVSGVPGGGAVNFYNMTVTDAGRGLWVDGGAADVNFQGMISQEGSASESVLVQGATGGTVSINRTLAALDTPIARNSDILQLDYGVFDTDSLAAAAIDVSLNTDLAFDIGWTEIGTPAQRGVAVQGNANSSMSFVDLKVLDAAGQAFVTQSNDSNSVIGIAGASALTSLSSTLPTFQSNDDAALAIELVSLESDIVTGGVTPAVLLEGSSSGVFTIREKFLVQATNPTPPPATLTSDGTAADVTNTTTGPVTVNLP
jgi:hypothetical protein